MGCSLAGRREPRWSGTIEELRERVGVAPKTSLNFSDFRRFVLDLAKAEIDQLAAFTMQWSEKRGARGKITHVTSTFTPKDDDATDAAADEAGRHSGGRKARREGTTETIVDTASLIASTASRLSVSDASRWPADDQVDGFKTPELHAIGVALGGGHAVQRLADQYARVQAAKATGISKASISRAINSGRISAIKKDDGSFSIEPVELHRVYPPKSAVPVTETSDGTIRNGDADTRNGSDSNVLQARLDAASEQLRDKDGTIDDLRHRLDRSDEERREAQARVIGLLAGPGPTESKRGFFGRSFGRPEE
ncbi:hypothetical protein OY671_006374 [Metschnikowia pulcherrima]|nr:hypothetical protein OY671_006374 [Metschnikowia pulcherrima]